MKGINTLRINYDTMKEIVQLWLTARFYPQTPELVKITVTDSWHIDNDKLNLVFELTLDGDKRQYSSNTDTKEEDE